MATTLAKHPTSGHLHKAEIYNDPEPEIIEAVMKDSEGRVVKHQYMKGKLLGKGGFAKCYYGVALPNKVGCALKIVLKTSLVKARAKQKLQSEIRIHRVLRHSNICRFERFFEDKVNAYMVLELCSNNSMSELIKRRKKLTEPEVRFYVGQLITALEYMHEHNVIHRDLKLGNLFLDSAMKVKVGDFGLATKLTHRDERKRTMCGTPNYIAPEILDGKDGHSFEVDIWSTGVIIYTLLVGKPPFESKDVKSTYKMILANNYSYPSHVVVSETSKNLIQSILQINPSHRAKLDRISGHGFFNGFTPDYLPSSALRDAPSLSQLQECLGPTSRSSVSSSKYSSAPSRVVRDENDAQAVNLRHSPGRVKTKESLTSRSSGGILKPGAMTEENRSAGLGLPSRRAGSHGHTSAAAPLRPVVDSRINTGASGPSKRSEVYSSHQPLDRESASTHVLYRARATETPSDGAIAAVNSTGAKSNNQEPEPDFDTADVPDEVDELQLQNLKISDGRKTTGASSREAWGAATHSSPARDVIKVSKDQGTLETMHEKLCRNINGGGADGLVERGKPRFSLGGMGSPIADPQSLVAKVWVTKYVDYTSKYGLGFLLNTGSAGVYFNDSTKIVLSPDGYVFSYVERRCKVPGGAAGGGASGSEHAIQSYPINQYPPELQKKVTLLSHFRNYLLDQKKEGGGVEEPAQDARRTPAATSMHAFNQEGASDALSDEINMPFLKKWVRTRHAILFRLSNRTVQVVFFDKSEILLSSDARIVTYVNKSAERSEHTLNDVLTTERADIAKRLKYTKDILYRLINLQNK